MSEIKKNAIAIENISDLADSLAKPIAELHPRILYINCDQYTNNQTNLIETYLATSLKSEGWVVDSFSNPQLENSYQAKNLFKDIICRLKGKFRFLKKLVRELPHYEIAYIECSSPKVIIRLALPALLLSRFFGRKSILFFPSSESERFLDKSARFYLPILKLADTSIVSSRYLQKIINRIGIKCSRIDHPLNFANINHRIISDLQPKILLFSPLEDEFDIQASIRAFALVKQKYPRSELIIAGDGSQKRRLEDLVYQKRTQGVSFIGYRKEEELPQLVSDCDLYLSSATATEPSNALVAAFAAGLPVVCTDADGLNQTVKNRVNALVSPVGDHVAIADNIIELIENSALTMELSKSGLVEAGRYSWSKVRVKWLRLLESLTISQ